MKWYKSMPIAGACLALALSTPIGAQGQGGGGGETETIGNNVAIPVIFPEGIGVTGYATSVDTGLRPTLTELPTQVEPIAPYWDAADLVTAADGTQVYKQQGLSYWRPVWRNGVAGVPEHVLVDWGDDLISQRWTTTSNIRVETGMYQVLPDGTTMNGYNMHYVTGEGTTEMWGAETTQVAYPIEVTTTETNEQTGEVTTVTKLVQPRVYSPTAHLKIEKITAPGGTVLSTGFDMSVADGLGGDGPGNYAAEVNVSGGLVYGYNWQIKSWPGTDEEKAGWYRLTFSLDKSASWTVTSEDGTSTTTTVNRNVTIDGSDPLDAADTTIFRPRLVDTDGDGLKDASILEVEVVLDRTGGQPLMPLSVALTGTGVGTVTSSPAGINCGTDCTENYTLDTVVTLTATPDKNSAFAGWAGDADCLDGSLTMTGGRYCEATFTTKSGTKPQAGSVDVNGDGRGDVLVYDTTTGDYSVAFLSGRGEIGKVAMSGSFPAGANTVVRPGDFDGDGMVDDYIGYSPDTGAFMMAFFDGQRFDEMGGTFPAGSKMSVLDLNGDHLSDVFLYNSTTGAWSRQVNMGGYFTTQSSGSWGPNWQVFPASLNGDAFDDLFLYNAKSGLWYRAFNDTANGFKYAYGYWYGDFQIKTGDFDKDGLTDVFLYDTRSGRYWMALTRVGNAFTYRNGTWGPGYEISTGDFNADGRSDVMLRRRTDGLWYQAITTSTGFAYAYGYWYPPTMDVALTDANADGKTDACLYDPTTGKWFLLVSRTIGIFDSYVGTWSTGLKMVGQMDLP